MQRRATGSVMLHQHITMRDRDVDASTGVIPAVSSRAWACRGNSAAPPPPSSQAVRSRFMHKRTLSVSEGPSFFAMLAINAPVITHNSGTRNSSRYSWLPLPYTSTTCFITSSPLLLTSIETLPPHPPSQRLAQPPILPPPSSIITHPMQPLTSPSSQTQTDASSSPLVAALLSVSPYYSPAAARVQAAGDQAHAPHSQQRVSPLLLHPNSHSPSA